MPNNIKIRPFFHEDIDCFIKMFEDYFRNDLRFEITYDEVEKLCFQIKESISDFVSLDMLLQNEKVIGFLLYQIDVPNSHWCEREGWGFIREVYINRDLRKNGFGAKLVKHTEEILYNRGINDIYLTSDEAGDFWVSCGYKKSGMVSEINHCPIYEKYKKEA